MTALAAVVIAAALVPVMFPFLQDGFPIGHDAGTHVSYAYRFDRTLREGQFPVRWVEAAKTGYGQPLFNFYQVGFYYLVSVVHTIVPNLLYALKATPVLLWWAGAAFMFLLFRRVGTLPAALAAVSFGLSPYLIVDVFVRASYPEFTAIVFGAGGLWAIDRLMTSEQVRFVAVAAVLLALTAISHLVATLIMAPMFAVYVVSLVADGSAPVKRLGRLVLAVLLAAGAAAFYTVPALLELQHVQIGMLIRDSRDFHEHFVPPANLMRFAWDYSWSYGASAHDPGDLLPIHVAATQWATLLLAVMVVAVRVVRRQLDGRAASLLAWLCIALGAMLMMTEASVMIWEALPPLSFAQFPWRFSLLLSFACAALSAVLLSLVPSRRLQAALLVLAVALQVHFYHRRLKPVGHLPAAEVAIDEAHWAETAIGKARDYVDGGFVPAGVTEQPQNEVGRWTLRAGQGRVEVIDATAARLLLDVQSDDRMELTVNSPYFPGWVVHVDGRAADITARPADRFMAVTVPPGAHRVEARFEDTEVRSLANLATLATGAISASQLIWLSLVRRRIRLRRLYNASSGW